MIELYWVIAAIVIASLMPGEFRKANKRGPNNLEFWMMMCISLLLGGVILPLRIFYKLAK